MQIRIHVWPKRLASQRMGIHVEESGCAGHACPVPFCRHIGWWTVQWRGTWRLVKGSDSHVSSAWRHLVVMGSQ